MDTSCESIARLEMFDTAVNTPTRTDTRRVEISVASAIVRALARPAMPLGDSTRQCDTHSTKEDTDMLRSRIIPVIGIAALVSGGTIGAAMAPSAGAAKTKTIKCTKLKGTETSGKVQASGCNGNTGTKSKKIAFATLIGGGAIKWANGKTTTIGAPTLSTGSLCPSPDTDVLASGTVTADTTGSAKPIPGVFSAEVCVDSSGNITLAPGTDMTAN
jgi:hypothetical protein